MEFFSYKNNEIQQDIWDDWKRLYEQNPNIDPFMNPDWHRNVFCGHRESFFNCCLNTVVIAGIKQNGVITLILPMVIKGKHAYCSGSLGGGDYVDFLYGEDIEPEALQNLLLSVKTKYSIETLRFIGFRSNSKTLVLLSGTNFQLEEETELCSFIEIPDTIADYRAKLTKSNRGKINLAFNRLEKEDKRAVFQILEGEALDASLNKTLKRIYLKRQIPKMHKGEPLYLKLKHAVANYVHHMPKTQVYKNLFVPSGTLCLLYIENKIAAYCYGIGDKGKYNIYHLAINDDYKFYSPGYLLVYHIIEAFSAQGEMRNKYKMIDFTVGDEQYKFKLGAQKASRTDVTVLF